VIVSIHQPAYLPWLGYFDKIARADLFIWLDNVQFQKNSFQNRNKIMTKDGPTWLTVPMRTSGALYETPLKDVEIDNSKNWRAKHLASIRMNYAKAPRFNDCFPALSRFYEREWRTLDLLCFEMLGYFNTLLGVMTPIRRASDMGADGAKSDLVLDLCKKAGATTYLSGALGRDYLDLASFAKAGIAVEFQDYKHPAYRQTYPGFAPNLAVVDLLMNEEEPRRFFNRDRAVATA
jgi:hypothetical protein